MAGLLNLVIGGALKGTGDAMVEQARATRDAAIAALDEQNKRTDAATQEGYQRQNIAQQGDIQTGLEGQRITGETDIADLNNDAALARTNVTEQGANTRNAADIQGRHEDTATTTAAQMADTKTQAGATVQAANIRGNASNYNANVRANALSNGKPLTPGQALMAARQAYADNLHAQISMADSDGNPIPANEWISTEADRLMQRNATARQAEAGGGSGQGSGLDASGITGGGLISPFGGSQQQPASSPVQQTQSAAPQVAPVQQAAPANSAVSIGGIPNVAPPIGAVDMLTRNPSLAPYFDQKYGQGSAAAALGR